MPGFMKGNSSRGFFEPRVAVRFALFFVGAFLAMLAWSAAPGTRPTEIPAKIAPEVLAETETNQGRKVHFRSQNHKIGTTAAQTRFFPEQLQWGWRETRFLWPDLLEIFHQCHAMHLHLWAKKSPAASLYRRNQLAFRYCPGVHPLALEREQSNWPKP